MCKVWWNFKRFFDPVSLKCLLCLSAHLQYRRKCFLVDELFGCLPSRLAIFREKNYSKEHGIDGNLDSFRRNSVRFTKRKKARYSVSGHSVEDKNTRNSVPNHFVKEKNSRNFEISFWTIRLKIKKAWNFVLIISEKRKTLRILFRAIKRIKNFWKTFIEKENTKMNLKKYFSLNFVLFHSKPQNGLILYTWNTHIHTWRKEHSFLWNNENPV